MKHKFSLHGISGNYQKSIRGLYVQGLGQSKVIKSVIQFIWKPTTFCKVMFQAAVLLAIFKHLYGKLL